jgi:hypothetical protein
MAAIWETESTHLIPLARGMLVLALAAGVITGDLDALNALTLALTTTAVEGVLAFFTRNTPDAETWDEVTIYHFLSSVRASGALSLVADDFAYDETLTADDAARLQSRQLSLGAFASSSNCQNILAAFYSAEPGARYVAFDGTPMATEQHLDDWIRAFDHYITFADGVNTPNAFRADHANCHKYYRLATSPSALTSMAAQADNIGIGTFSCNNLIVSAEAFTAARRSEAITRILGRVTIAGIQHMIKNTFPDLMLHMTVTPQTISAISARIDPTNGAVDADGMSALAARLCRGLALAERESLPSNGDLDPNPTNPNPTYHNTPAAAESPLQSGAHTPEPPATRRLPNMDLGGETATSSNETHIRVERLIFPKDTMSGREYYCPCHFIPNRSIDNLTDRNLASMEQYAAFFCTSADKAACFSAGMSTRRDAYRLASHFSTRACNTPFGRRAGAGTAPARNA